MLYVGPNGMDTLKRSVIICGLIGSGKTTAAKYVSLSHQFSIVSAGETIRELATLSGRASKRKDLQASGKDFLMKHGALHFAEVLVRKGSDRVVFEGIRPIEVVENIKIILPNSIIIFINVDERIRISRFTALYKEPVEKFYEYMSDPLERDAARIQSIANYTIANNDDINHLYAELDRIISTGASKHAQVD